MKMMMSKMSMMMVMMIMSIMVAHNNRNDAGYDDLVTQRRSLRAGWGGGGAENRIE